MMESLKSGKDLRTVFAKDEVYSRIGEQVGKEEALSGRTISSKKEFADCQRDYAESFDNALDFIASSELTIARDSKQDLEKISLNANRLIKDAILKSDGSDQDVEKYVKQAV